MRSADESRVCRYSVPTNPDGICGRILAGHGRYKWCLLHSEIVRRKRRRARNARWQRAWRVRQPLTYHNRRWIARHVDVLHRRLVALLGSFNEKIDSRLAYWRLLADLEERLLHAVPPSPSILAPPMLRRGRDIFVLLNPNALPRPRGDELWRCYLRVHSKTYTAVWMCASEGLERCGIERDELLIRQILLLAARQRWFSVECTGVWATRLPRLARLLNADDVYYLRVSEGVGALAPRSVREESRRRAS